MQNKLKLLKSKLEAYDGIAIAFSGGVDSTFLLLVAHEILGINALAITVTGPHFNPSELNEAKLFCKKHDIPQLIVGIDEATFQTFAHNPTDRCYICKKAIFEVMKNAAGQLPLADGTNADDDNDYRPGIKALNEMGIISPLKEVGFTKQEIRIALKAMNEDIWNKPAFACLASRIPYNMQITRKKLEAIYKAEEGLKELGFTQVRVRHHGDVARIEVLPAEINKFFDEGFMNKVNELVKKAGFIYAALDLGGYMMGNLNLKI